MPPGAELLPALLILLVGVAAYAAYAAPPDTIRSNTEARASPRWRTSPTGGSCSRDTVTSRRAAHHCPRCSRFHSRSKSSSIWCSPSSCTCSSARLRRPALVLGLAARVLAAASTIEIKWLSGNIDRVLLRH